MSNLKTAQRAAAAPFALAQVAPVTAGVYPRGAYGSGVTYKQGDLVQDGGVDYLSLQGSNVGHTPASSPTYWESLGGGGGPDPDATPLTLTTQLLSASTNGRVVMYDPVGAAANFESLTTNPLSTPGHPMVYSGNTLTAGENADLSALGLTVGASLLFAFRNADPANGPYTVTDLGADDPGGHKAVFTRRADFDSSGDIRRGATFLVNEDGETSFLYRLDGNGPWTLGSTPLPFSRILFPVAPRAISMTSMGQVQPGTVALVDTTSGLIAVTLPSAEDGVFGPITVKKVDAASNDVLILPLDGSETIDGAADYTLSAQYQKVTLVSDGSRWWVVG